MGARGPPGPSGTNGAPGQRGAAVSCLFLPQLPEGCGSIPTTEI